MHLPSADAGRLAERRPFINLQLSRYSSAVEQLFRKQQVVRSIRTIGSKPGWLSGNSSAFVTHQSRVRVPLPAPNECDAVNSDVVSGVHQPLRWVLDLLVGVDRMPLLTFW